MSAVPLVMSCGHYIKGKLTLDLGNLVLHSASAIVKFDQILWLDFFFPGFQENALFRRGKRISRLLPSAGRIDLILDPSPFPHRHFYHKFDPGSVKVRNNLLAKEGRIEPNFDDYAGEQPPNLLDTIAHHNQCALGVVDIAWPVAHLKKVTSLRDMAKERIVTFGESLVRVVATKCPRNFIAARKHRAIEVERDAGQVELFEFFLHDLGVESYQCLQTIVGELP